MNIGCIGAYAEFLKLKKEEEIMGLMDGAAWEKEFGVEDKNILEQASEIVDGGDREKSYGTPYSNMKHIADIFNSITGHNLSASDVAILNLAQKLSREQYTHKEDNLIDLAGYSYVYNECKKNEEK